MTIKRVLRLGMPWSLAFLTILPGVYAQLPRSASRNSSQADLKSAASAREQDAQSADVARELMARRAFTAVAGERGQAFDFSGWEVEYRFGDKPVKGAPFSAQIITEDSRTLANGVHISHKWTGAIYRDSEGRTRREQPSQTATEIVMIEDPVGAVSYRLNLPRRTGLKIPYEAIQRKLDAEKAARSRAEEDSQKPQADEASQKERAEGAAVKARSGGPGGGSGGPGGGPPDSVRTLTPQGYVLNRTFAQAKTELAPKIESLGKQMVEGVEAEGTRSTITIPAGTEGNDQPFDIVSERWYSADLQMTVMSKHSDPRTGDNVYRLVNINRSEPPSALFAPPSDFTLDEPRVERRRRE